MYFRLAKMEFLKELVNQEYLNPLLNGFLLSKKNQMDNIINGIAKPKIIAIMIVLKTFG